MHGLDILNARIAKHAAAPKDNPPFPMDPKNYCLGNIFNFCSPIYNDPENEWQHQRSRISTHGLGVWMHTLLSILSEVDINVLTLDTVYNYAKATNASFLPLVEGIAVSEERNSAHADEVLGKIIQSYGNSIRKYLTKKIFDMFETIYVQSIKEVSSLRPIDIEARSGEYMRSRIKHIQARIGHLDRGRVEVSITKDIDAMLVAAQGYRMAAFHTGDENSNSISGGSLTSSDMIDLLNAAKQAIDEGACLYSGTHVVNYRIKLIADIYRIVHYLCAGSSTGSFDKDYKLHLEVVRKNTPISSNRMAQSDCRQMSGMDPLAALCFIGIMNSYKFRSHMGRTVADQDPDSKVERLLMLMISL